MAKTPYLLQTGMGVDLHGGDDTTAACRAVTHAIHHNSLLFLREVGLHSAGQVHVDVTIACPHPEQVDTEAVAAALPVGVVSVEAQSGGMLAATGTEGDDALIAIAAVRVSVSQS
ncbi:MAG: Lin0512 family protein [Deltaproteobacteria bacterium]|nr:Lin0512 family protein [Deltaproteobacteria bacterium]